MSTRSLILLVGCLLITVILATTNPSTQEYDAFLESTVSQAVEHRAQQVPEQQGQVMQNLLQALLKPFMQSVVRPNTVRRNFGLFSLFETRVMESRVLVLGIGTVFVPLRGVEDIIQKLERLAPKRNVGQ